MPDNNNFKPPAAATSRGGGGSMKRQLATAAAQQQEPLRCPRCNSSYTKFCYYNNYSLSQPRHFCKSCKRYWTCGGTLRNVPVGGGCRKNKRGVKRPAPAAATGSTASAGSRSTADGNKPLPLFSYGNPPKVNLGYASLGFPSVIRGNGGGFVVPSANSVIPEYGSSSDFPPTTSLDGIPTVASSLLPSTIFQDQHKFMSMGDLGFKEDTGIRNNLKPFYSLENVQLTFDEGRHVDDINWSVPCQIHEIDPCDLTKSWCWSTIGNGTVASWHHETGSNVGSSVPYLI